MEAVTVSREGGAYQAAIKKAAELVFRDVIELNELQQRMRHIEARGIFDENGRPIQPYKNAKFSMVTILPPDTSKVAEPPMVEHAEGCSRLWTPQPTIYQDQLFIMSVIDKFLHSHSELIVSADQQVNEATVGLNGLTKAVLYDWPNRGSFHVMPPVIERHTYHLSHGAIDLDDLRDQFDGSYVKDAEDNLHALSDHDLQNFYIDHETYSEHLPIFNPTVELLDYGRQQNGSWQFDVICDGAHRIAYGIEELGMPVQAILVEAEDTTNLLPYYAVPRPFHPATRLSSKRAERMYGTIENDKIHLLQELIKKAGHYDWSPSGLHVSSLRSREKE